MNNNDLNGMVNKSYYDKNKAHKYYEKNKNKINNRSKKKWAKMTQEEKDIYYKNRKVRRLKRRLKERLY